MLGGEPAPRAIVANCALKRQPSMRPLVLRVERVVLGPVALLPRRDSHSHRVERRRERREVGQRVVSVAGLIFRLFDVIRAAIAELQGKAQAAAGDSQGGISFRASIDEGAIRLAFPKGEPVVE